MKRARIKIKGKTALLFHKFSIDVLTNKSKQKSGSTGNDPEEWKTTIFNDGKKLYMPGAYFFSTFLAGASYVKLGRGTIAKKLAGCMTVVTEKSYLNRELPDDPENIETENMPLDSSQPVYLDVRGVKNPATKGRNVRYRVALSPGWECSVEIEFDDTVISKDDIKRCVENAGKFSGIADGRTIGHGRFEVTEIIFE